MVFRFIVALMLLSVAGAGCRVAPGSEGSVAARSYGAALYVERCALCHGAQGEGMGKVGTALASQEFLATADDHFLEVAIAKGRPNTTMSPWAENGLNEVQIRSLARYIRQWQTVPTQGLDPTYVARGDAARGEELYNQHCAACHGPQGNPGRDPNLTGTYLANPVFLAQASDAFLTYGIAHGRSGTGMQAFGQARGGLLSDQDIADLVTYMRSWQK